MRSLLNDTILMVVAVFAVSPVVIAQNPSGPGSETATDLSGVWERMRQGAARSFYYSQEPPSLTPWAAEIFRDNRDVNDPVESGNDDVDPTLYCLPDGMPRVYTGNDPFEIVQSSGGVYILFERGHLVRRIYLDGRTMPEGYPLSFMGYSTGRWEEDTLVVETIGLNDSTWMDRTGHPHSEALRVVERFRRPDRDTLEIDFLFEDSQAFTKPWGAKERFQLQSDLEIMEHNGVCEARHIYDYSQKSRLGTDWADPKQY